MKNVKRLIFVGFSVFVFSFAFALSAHESADAGENPCCENPMCPPGCVNGTGHWTITPFGNLCIQYEGDPAAIAECDQPCECQ